MFDDNARETVREAHGLSLEIRTLLDGKRTGVVVYALSEVVAAALNAWPEERRAHMMQAFAKAVAMQLVLLDMNAEDDDKPVVN